MSYFCLREEVRDMGGIREVHGCPIVLTGSMGKHRSPIQKDPRPGPCRISVRATLPSKALNQGGTRRNG